MSTDKDDLVSQIMARLASGEHYEDVVDSVVQANGALAGRMLKRLLVKAVEKEAKSKARRPDGFAQLSLDFGDGTVGHIADRVVYITEADGTKIIKDARYATGAERERSLHQWMNDCKRQISIAEGEIQKEMQLQSVAALHGIDLVNEPFYKAKAQLENIKCWRCGMGFIDGVPFESGHSDKPFSQGGTEMRWEHRSCNRSAKDNPVNSVEQTTNDEEAA